MTDLLNQPEVHLLRDLRDNGGILITRTSPKTAFTWGTGKRATLRVMRAIEQAFVQWIAVDEQVLVGTDITIYRVEWKDGVLMDNVYQVIDGVEHLVSWRFDTWESLTPAPTEDTVLHEKTETQARYMLATTARWTSQYLTRHTSTLPSGIVVEHWTLSDYARRLVDQVDAQ